MSKLKRVINFLITTVLLIFLIILSWKYYPYFYKTFMSLEKIKVDSFGEYYSPNKRFKAIKYQIPRLLMDSVFVRVTDVETSKVLGDITHNEFFYYEYINNKFCIDSKTFYHNNLFGVLVEIKESERCVDLK